MAEPRTIVVIGADGGLGAAIAAHLERDGERVIAIGRQDADLREPGAIAAVLERLGAAGPVDGLVHAAGLYPAAMLLGTADLRFDEVLAVNTRSALEAGRAVARIARDRGAPCSVVMLSSPAAHRARPGTAVYAASKAGLEAIVRALALEGAPHGVRCNAVAPGFVPVASRENPVPPSYEAAQLRVAPTGRLGEPADIARIVQWLLDPASAWVTGQSIVADGGASLGSAEAPSWVPEA